MDAKAKVKRGELFSTLSMPVLLVILIVFFSIMSPRFLSPLNLTNILVQNVHVAIVAAAVMIIMIAAVGVWPEVPGVAAEVRVWPEVPGA